MKDLNGLMIISNLNQAQCVTMEALEYVLCSLTCDVYLGLMETRTGIPSKLVYQNKFSLNHSGQNVARRAVR